jgi:hypothetical protein
MYLALVTFLTAFCFSHLSLIYSGLLVPVFFFHLSFVNMNRGRGWRGEQRIRGGGREGGEGGVGGKGG